MARPKRQKSERYEASLAPEPDEYWCSGCPAWLPKELFARCAKWGRQRYCRACHAKAMREHRARNVGADTERYRSDPEHRKRVRARSRMKQRKARGKLKAEPCEECGNPEAQMHHDNYDNPTEIRWLCVGCHGGEHYPAAQPARRAEVADRLAQLAEKYRARA